MTLSREEMERYSRQIIDISERGQERLRDASVAVLGAGGLGTPVLHYLAAAGVGLIRAVDRADVQLSNLNRQFYLPSDVGKPKAFAAQERLRALNPSVRVEPVRTAISGSNARELIEDFSIVVDCLDNLEARMDVSSACMGAGKPLVHGAAEGWKGFQMTCVPGKAYLDAVYGGKEGPKGELPILGPAAGVIGSLQALEVIKLATREGRPNTRLLIFDGKENSMEYVAVTRRRLL